MRAVSAPSPSARTGAGWHRERGQDRAGVDEEATAEPLVLRGHEARHSVAFSPDGKRVASGSQEQAVRVWSRKNRWGAGRAAGP